MKRIYFIIIACLAVVAVKAQTVNVKVGQVTYVHRATNVGEMPFAAGSTLTIEGKVYSVDKSSSTTDFIDEIAVGNTDVEDNTVSVSYNGSTASVVVAGNVARYLTVSVSGAHVSIVQADDLTDEITYTLSGTSTDGEFYMDGSLKASIALAGLTLTNPSGPAINIQNGKRIDVSVKSGTENTLRDGSGGDWKGCFRCKGHTEFKGKGTLNVYGNTAHAIWSKEYVEMKNCTINVLKAVGDGLNCNQYFLMESGTLNISGVGDDGIQVSYETDDDGNRETDEENTGALTITGGTLTVTTSAVGSKGLKAEGAVVINENSATTLITVKNSGGVDTSDSTDPTSSACLKSDTSIDIAAGTLTLTNTGQGGRAINSEGTLTVTGGTINAQAQGSNYGSSGGGGGGGWPPGGGGRPGGGGSSSSNGKNAKGIKAKGAINISGGSLTVGSANHEGLESKSTMTISGGKVYVKASDDAINSSGNFTISGGYVYAWSTGNDGLDSNGNMSIEGGVALGFASSSNNAESGIDVDERHSLSIKGGDIFSIGGRNDFRAGTSSQTYKSFSTLTVSANSYAVVKCGSTQLFAVKIPASYSNKSGVISATTSASGTLSVASSSSVSGTEVNGYIDLR